VWTGSWEDETQRDSFPCDQHQAMSVMSSLELTGHKLQMLNQDENTELAGQGASGEQEVVG
jgi:hypothetical protein